MFQESGGSVTFTHGTPGACHSTWHLVKAQSVLLIEPLMCGFETHIVGWLDEWVDAWMDAWMDGWVDGWMDGWMDGWVDGRMDRWMDGWMGR